MKLDANFRDNSTKDNKRINKKFFVGICSVYKTKTGVVEFKICKKKLQT